MGYTGLYVIVEMFCEEGLIVEGMSQYREVPVFAVHQVVGEVEGCLGELREQGWAKGASEW